MQPSPTSHLPSQAQCSSQHIPRVAKIFREAQGLQVQRTAPCCIRHQDCCRIPKPVLPAAPALFLGLDRPAASLPATGAESSESVRLLPAMCLLTCPNIQQVVKESNGSTRKTSQNTRLVEPYVRSDMCLYYFVLLSEPLRTLQHPKMLTTMTASHKLGHATKLRPHCRPHCFSPLCCCGLPDSLLAHSNTPRYRARCSSRRGLVFRLQAGSPAQTATQVAQAPTSIFQCAHSNIRHAGCQSQSWQQWQQLRLSWAELARFLGQRSLQHHPSLCRSWPNMV